MITIHMYNMNGGSMNRGIMNCGIKNGRIMTRDNCTVKVLIMLFTWLKIAE